MAVTKTSICNKALALLGVTKFMTNVDTDNTPIANVFLQVYDEARNEVFAAFAWPFATLKWILTLSYEQPDGEFAYAYEYPENCMQFHRIIGKAVENTGAEETTADCVVEGVDFTFIQSGEIAEANGRRRRFHIPHRINKGPSGTLVLTDQVDAAAEYTVLVTDPTLYPPAFVNTLALRLAADVAAAVTGGDPKRLGERMLQRYFNSMNLGQTIAANEEQSDSEPDYSLLGARN